MYCMDNPTLFVTDIERSAIHDGPGLRTVVFMQGCCLRCYWCCNPETRPVQPVLLHDVKTCVGCGACVSVCPNGAISLQEGRAVVERHRCSGCGKCVAPCPVGANTLSGQAMTVVAIMAEVEKDRSYYAATGGGMTLSGGEPLLQKGVAALLRCAKERGISTWVETTACLPWETIAAAQPYIDGFYVDYKHPDGEALRLATGADLSLVEENLRRLVELGARVTLRTPVIPGFNEDRDLLHRCVAFSASLGLQRHVLLPYHSLGRGKYEKLGLPYPLKDVPNMEPAALEDVRAIGTELGVEIQIGG